MNISWLYEESYSGRVKAVMVEVTASLPTSILCLTKMSAFNPIRCGGPCVLTKIVLHILLVLPYQNWFKFCPNFSYFSSSSACRVQIWLQHWWEVLREKFYLMTIFISAVSEKIVTTGRFWTDRVFEPFTSKDVDRSFFLLISQLYHCDCHSINMRREMMLVWY